MASTYTAPDLAQPASSQTGSAFATSANKNDQALAYASISGGLLGWTYSQSGGTAEQPTTQTWASGVYRVRHTITWGTAGGEAGNLKTIVVAVSQDSGSSYATAFTVTNTFDASGNLTASSGGGGFVAWLSYLLGKVKSAVSTLTAHVAATGTAVHGLGTMSTQNANAVAITAGSINAVIGASSRNLAYFQRALELYGVYTPGSGASVTLDMSNGGSFVTNSGTNTLVFSNPPLNGYVGSHFVHVSAFNNTTWPGSVDWGKDGRPSIAGWANVSLLTLDGGSTWVAAIHSRQN